MSVIEQIGKINKEIRSFQLKLRKPGVRALARKEIEEEIKKLNLKRNELCKKL